MKNNIEKSLKRAISQLPHPAVQELWEQPVNKMTEHDYITRQETPKSLRIGSRTRAFLATAACFMVIFAGSSALHYQNQVIHTVVDIDINPSVELNLNRKDKIVSIVGLNREAEKLLNAVDIKGKDASSAIELILIEAKEQQYFSQKENAVLLSVSTKNNKKAVLLEEELSQQVRIAVDRKETPVTVVSQQFDKDDKELKNNSSKYKISQGKMALINQLETFDLSYTREQLASLSIEELLLLLREEEAELSDRVKVDSSTWISKEASEPVLEETKPEVEETREAREQETEPTPAKTKPAPAKTNPVPAKTRPAAIENPTPGTKPPIQQPHTPIPEADDLDDDDTDDINGSDDDGSDDDGGDDNGDDGGDDSGDDGGDDGDDDGGNDDGDDDGGDDSGGGDDDGDDSGDDNDDSEEEDD